MRKTRLEKKDMASKAEVLVSGGRSTSVFHVQAQDLSGYVNTLFDGAMCKSMREKTGRASQECGKSTAFTSWDHSVPQLALYDARGRKQALKVLYRTEATLPLWKGIEAASTNDAAEGRRANLRTALHEAGHQNAPVLLTAAISRLAAAMPATVPASDVAAYNSGIAQFIEGFYAVMARLADARYDGTTGHGFTQGASYSDVPITEPSSAVHETPLDVKSPDTDMA